MPCTPSERLAIKYRPLYVALSLSLALDVAVAAPAAKKEPSPIGWSISTRVDPMTDGKTCFLNSPTKKISLSFQGDGEGYKLYVVTDRPLTVDRMHLMEFRVDKNPSIQVRLRTIRPTLFAVDPRDSLGSLETLVEQFDGGRSFIVNTLAIGNPPIEEDGGTLVAFAPMRRVFDDGRGRLDR